MNVVLCPGVNNGERERGEGGREGEGIMRLEVVGLLCNEDIAVLFNLWDIAHITGFPNKSFRLFVSQLIFMLKELLSTVCNGHKFQF